MSLGENLQFLRKKDNITQEQLAEQLEVSRQSVSKWESDTAYPEMEKIIQICDLFHVGMDDLVRKDVSLLYVGDKTEYDNHMNIYAKMMAAGVGIILLGVSLMFLLEGLNMKFLWFPETYYDALGVYVEEGREGVFVGVLMIFVTIAVAIFILFGLRYGDYWKKHTSLPQFYSQSEIAEFQRKFAFMIAAGVTIILIDVIILVSLEALFPVIEKIEYLECFSVALFMLLIAVAVPILVFAGAQASKYNITHWNEMHDENSEAYKKNQLKRAVCGCLMMIATILFLIVGFILKWWGMSAAVIYSVFGIFCGIASVIIEHRTFKK
ncbi:MAG: helix-turn-helix transcriptional regulator [Lachnospiraceae bacterium]|nr:helix-turn-helix transcriptional regulator [Lachnospiraceae bacterium]